MDILKIATAGSVDVGKSTLIGRLLFDTRSVTKDKLEAVELSSKRKGLDFVDLSLLTDGLIAEREQNITIDVAHIFFSTPNRKYILADSPGHFEYTRNMITGASGADAFIILIDAGIGVTEQTKRHLFIASLLNIETVFVCINKMDTAAFAEAVFNAERKHVQQLAGKIGLSSSLYFIPVAAKTGDNIVLSSKNMSWYNGKTLLQYMEEILVHQKELTLPAKMPVQLTFRSAGRQTIAGRLISGALQPKQSVTILPSMQEAVIRSIWHSGKLVGTALAGQSLAIEVESEVDITRGDMIIASGTSFSSATNIRASMCWLNEQSMMLNRNYLLQHGVNTVAAKISAVHKKVDIHSMEEMIHTTELMLNDIGTVTIETAEPIFADTYKVNPGNGSFILIDETSNNTVAVGFIEGL